MSAYDFWYEDSRLFECYVKAYHNRIDKTAWINGLYVLEAVSCAINNVMPSTIGSALSGKRIKPLKYHEKPIGMFEMPKPHKATTSPQDGNVLSGVALWQKRIMQLKGMEV